MFGKKIIVIVGLLCCFFEHAQSGMNREQLEIKLGKPVYRFVQPLDYTLIIDDYEFRDYCLYTTELSKILLVGENRFDDFIESIGKSSQKQLREAIQDTLLLTGGSSKAYSMSKLLYYLEDILQRKIDFIENQIKFDYTYDQESVFAAQKSFTVAVALIVFASVAQAYIPSDAKNSNNTNVSNAEGLYSLAILGLIPALYIVLKNSYEVLTKNPRAHNQYLKEYQDLLEFVQNLIFELKEKSCISFTLDNGNLANIKEYSPFPFSLFPVHSVAFS